MMKKLYNKSELSFALVWIGLYVIVMNIALRFCGGFDNLADKTIFQVLIPVICILVLAIASTLWIIKNGLAAKYGLTAFRGNIKTFLWFLPLVVMSLTNLKNGLAIPASFIVSFLMAVNLAVVALLKRLYFAVFCFALWLRITSKVPSLFPQLPLA